MAEEKVGFGFEFGVKGDKEVRKSLEDVIRLMGTAQNIGSALSGVLGKGFGLLEFGAAAGPIALAAAALGTFAYKASEAGENLRRVRQDMIRLDRVPSMALTDSQLEENTNAVVDHFKDLGLEAGNQFTTSFATKLRNFSIGAYAVNWDVQAAIANLFGAGIKSYEQTSPEAMDAQNRVYQNQATELGRTKQAERTQQGLFAITKQAASDIADVYAQRYLASPQSGIRGNNGAGINSSSSYVGGGVLPESYIGQSRLRDIRRQSDIDQKMVLMNQTAFDESNLKALRSAPIPNRPGTNIPDPAARAQAILTLESKINDGLQKQIDLRQDVLNLDKEQRDLARSFIGSQNYGSYRALGGGGRTIYDAGPNGGPSIAQQIGLIPGMGARNPGARGGGGMGSINDDILGRVHGSAAGFPGFNPGSMQGLDVLKDINKNIGKIGIPTLSN